jgi:hypothetical protein
MAFFIVISRIEGMIFAYLICSMFGHEFLVTSSNKKEFSIGSVISYECSGYKGGVPLNAKWLKTHSNIHWNELTLYSVIRGNRGVPR